MHDYKNYLVTIKLFFSARTMPRIVESGTQRIPWRLLIIGVLLGLASPWIYFTFLMVNLEDVIKIGIAPIMLTSSLIIIRLLIQGLRFYTFIKGSHVNFNPKIRECILVRIGSEFVAATSLSYIGDELVRAGYLIMRGLDSGKALWISYSETFYDVFMGTSITIIAALYIILMIGDITLGSILLMITLPILFFYLFIFYTGLTGRTFSHTFEYFHDKVGRSSLLGKMINWLKETYSSFSSSLRLYHSSLNKYVILLNVFLTMVLSIIYGLTVLIIYDAGGVRLEFFESLLAAYSGVALGVLPITLGGSGTTELGISLYIHSLKGEWAGAAVVAWRLATHITTLIISFVFLMFSLPLFMKKTQPAV
ncbi:MAG: lysylphosphatidylglycerol synthase transmembrane domain-containing protein [Nitrososphaerota archaeon]